MKNGEKHLMITRTKYKPKEIETKWRTQWEAEQLYHAPTIRPNQSFITW